MTRMLLVAVAVAGLLAAACHSSTEPGVLASIAVTPNATLAIRSTQQFVAVGKDAAGVVVTIAPTWSLVAGGGTISKTGLFTAGTEPGTYVSTIMASSSGIAGTASVTVTNGTVATGTRP